MMRTDVPETVGGLDLPPVLSGVRVLEIGHFVAAPFCSRLLGDLGADVIKIEPPGGDPVRQWGEQIGGNSLWWSVHGRNKRSLTLNLKSPQARQIVLKLAQRCDALVENFRPGHLAQLGLGAEALRAANPKLIVAQISGYGQDGPYRSRAAFGVIGEAMGGLRYLTNQACPSQDMPPVRVGVSIGDSLAGLYAALGIAAALWRRDGQEGDGKGRLIDVALSESVLSMMEGMLPEYSMLGKIKQPTGGAIATAAPSNAYPSADGHWILIAANSDPLFAKLAAAMGAPDLAAQPRFLTNPSRVAHARELDGIIARWSETQRAEELLACLNAAGIPTTKIYNAADCAADPHFRARGAVQEVDDPLFGRILHPGIVPRLPEQICDIRRTGPAIGQHTDEILTDLLGLSPDEISALRASGAV